MTGVPEVSVIMPSYNHERFVAEAIASVLSQEGVDLELLVSDDGSADGTREVVASCSDPRLRFWPNVVNRGAGVVTNELVSAARGEFVALINSDDAWVAGKLHQQLDFMRSNPQVGACFGRASFIDGSGSEIPSETLPFGRVFDQPNRSQGEWLRQFFANGNCICHPTMLVRRSVYEHLGLYSNRFRQLPDFEMWIRVVKHYPIYISEHPLIRFRVLPGENASSPTAVNATRTLNEHLLIADEFFDGVDATLLREGFGDLLARPDVPTPIHVEIEKALLLLHDNMWLGRPYRIIALLMLRRLLEDADCRSVMEHEYGIGDRWFHERCGEFSPMADAAVPPGPSLRSTVGRVARKLKSTIGF